MSVHDGKAADHTEDTTTIDDTIRVTITVTDVDEAPVVSGDTSVNYFENSTDAVATYTAKDPENRPISWSVSDTTAFAITGGVLTFQSPPDYEVQGSHTVTVTAEDPGGQSDSVTVTISIADVNEPPVAGDDEFRFAEDTASSLEVLVNDTDPETDRDDLTLEVRTDPGNGMAVVEAGTGQIIYTPAPDYYGSDSFSYTVSDGEYSATALVSLTVTPVNDAPEFPGTEPVTRSVPENIGTGSVIGSPVTATDVDDTRLTYTLDPASAATFAIDDRGQVRTQAALDHEFQSRYFVTVAVRDGKDEDGNPDPLTDATITVTITVTDAPGMVTLSSTRPQVGSPLTATLREYDEPVADATWHWERSADGSVWSRMDDATTEVYTPRAADVDYYLRATVSYTDRDGTTGKEALGVAAALVSDRPQSPPPRPPGGGRPPGRGGGPACTQEDVHGNTVAQATEITLTAPTAGAICPTADVDYFTVTAPSRGLIFVDTPRGISTRGTIWQDGVVRASSPTGGSGPDARLGARVQAGPVVVALQGQGRATGDYELVVTLTPGYLENPGPHSFQSGVGVLSGWVCDADAVEIVLNGQAQPAAYGTERLDTEPVCGDTDNGFGLLFNWNLLRDGEHEVVALVDGVELDRATVTVTTLGQEFLRDVAGTCEVKDFPALGETVTLVWQQNSQNFVIAGGSPPVGPPTGRTSALTGFLENPGHNSFQSGVSVLSGWVCEADTVELALGHLGRQEAAYGTERLDTQAVCGDVDNSFGLLVNWNRLGEGEHTVVAYVDGVELGRATVRVTTVGAGAEEEFLRGVEGACVVEDFPALGQSVLLEWQQNSQNFVITDIE